MKAMKNSAGGYPYIPWSVSHRQTGPQVTAPEPGGPPRLVEPVSCARIPTRSEQARFETRSVALAVGPAALAVARADRGGGDDPESRESGGAVGPRVEPERERPIDRVVAGGQVVGPGGRERGRDGEGEHAADLLGGVDQA